MGDIERQKVVKVLKPKAHVMNDVVSLRIESVNELFINNEWKLIVVVDEQDSVALLVIHRKTFKRLLGSLSGCK